MNSCNRKCYQLTLHMLSFEAVEGSTTLQVVRFDRIPSIAKSCTGRLPTESEHLSFIGSPVFWAAKEEAHACVLVMLTNMLAWNGKHREREGDTPCHCDTFRMKCSQSRVLAQASLSWPAYHTSQFLLVSYLVLPKKGCYSSTDSRPPLRVHICLLGLSGLAMGWPLSLHSHNGAIIHPKCPDAAAGRFSPALILSSYQHWHDMEFFE